MCFFKPKELYPYKVVVFINGRHPYLDSNELDYESRHMVFTVPAYSWADAERKGLNAASKLDGWSYSVITISKDW